jgi:hypothetical protein
MPAIIFSAGAKGGTGKSTIIRFLITYLREQGFNPSLLDMDDENYTLSRFFPEAQRVDIKKTSSHDVLIEKTLAGDNLIVADLKAGTGKDALDWWLDVPFSELPDIRFICFAAITSSPDSVQSFLHWAAAIKDKAAYFVCKNQKDGDVFTDYDDSNEGLLFRENFKPHHVLIPRLDEEYMTELERLNLSVSEVLAAGGNATINGKDIGTVLCRLMVRARLRRFQQNIYEQFEPVLKHIKQ